tara:strand:- start:1253 stop:1480 length:228 start_codon:yes stop_codon:yes gene_type:complete
MILNCSKKLHYSSNKLPLILSTLDIKNVPAESKLEAILNQPKPDIIPHPFQTALFTSMVYARVELKRFNTNMLII